MMNRQGIPLPRHLQKLKKEKKKNKVQTWMKFYFKAFNELTTERSFGMSPGPIPISAVTAWGQFHKMLPWEFEEFKYLISRMDQTWLDWWQKESEKKSKEAKRDAKKT